MASWRPFSQMHGRPPCCNGDRMSPQSRLASLDALRGFAIASMVLVNNPGDWKHLYAPLAHARWNGWTFTDVVFPMFLFCAGVAMALSLGRRARDGALRPALLATSARRAAVVFLVGLALNFVPSFDPATVRIPGVLQRIALCLVIAAPVVIWGGWRSAVLAIVALFAAYALPMLLVPVSGADGIVAAGRLEPGNDFGAWVDRWVFGAHLWSQSRTWDPEGIVSTLPAAASLLFGVLAGHYIKSPSRSERAPAMAIAGIAFLVTGLVLDAIFMPINKNLWTPSYAVFMTGWSLLSFALFHAFMDESAPPLRERVRLLFLPLTIFGMNALFIFAFSGLVARLLGKEPLYAPIRALPLAPETASLVFALLFEAAMFAVAWLMWKKRWFVTA
jgi:predicted acyltransferase